MNFGANHYVPILKVKRGEKAALQKVRPSLRERITPLLQIVERTDKGIDAHLETSFSKLAASLSGYSRCFLDAQELASEGPHAARHVFERASEEGMLFTPVTGVTRNADVAAAMDHRQNGLALRLTRSEFESGSVGSLIEQFLDSHELAASDVDLIVDLGAVTEMIVAGVSTLAEGFLADVPQPQEWRTLTISACAFPMSMGDVARHSHDLVERADWLSWRDSLYANRHAAQRLPAFSDYAIQHPAGVEGFDPRIMQVSAAIRYTTDTHWLLVKGESTRSTRPGEQFPDLATRLVYGHLQTYFAGVDHCQGCKSIKDAADGEPGFGSAEAWRRLGTIHHISEVMRALDSLPWP